MCIINGKSTHTKEGTVLTGARTLAGVVCVLLCNDNYVSLDLVGSIVDWHGL